MYFFKHDNYLSKNIKYFLNFILYSVFAIIIFFLFAHNISKTNPINKIDSSNDNSVEVGSFNDTSSLINKQVNEFTNDLFNTRNSSFLSGDVKDLSRFYNLGNTNSTYCINNELRRISYLRDWAIERGIIFTKIRSTVTINDINESGDRITFKADENCEFNYIYYDDPTENTFNVTTFHVLSLNKTSDTLEVEKDYYLDFLSNSSANYPYKLNEGHLEYGKSFDNSFTINSSLNIGDMLSYRKFNYTDHTGVVCGYDSKNYPLITSETIRSTNLPFDLGWKEKNISK